ncbi:TonB-dependent receptor [Pseudomonas sp. GCEP-101]|uniref:TonB-dependent receptor n=1 Tax=Pseudomonas sp. GCEP-101 TaxID=2974552 RepID=UPI00223B9278|nr:TonB-dependent receptor [Pseudomonas sp. GCEP-101]
MLLRSRLRPHSLALAVGLALTGGVALPALAAEAASQQRQHAIAPGPLGEVLARFAAQAGVPLAFEAQALNSRQSAGLNGSFTPEQGLERLLEGSGYRLVRKRSGYGVEAAPDDSGALEMDATTVSGALQQPGDLPPAYAGGQVARGAQLGMLGNQDIQDVPFSFASYTARTIQDTQAQTVGDVLLNDASVRQGNGYGNFSQIFVIRGLPLSTDDVSLNGLYGVTPRQIIGTESLERVELFKGPNAFINGVTPSGSGIGGAVNLQTKRAEDTPTRSVTLGYGSDNQIGEHLDLGQRFGEDNRFGARVNVAQREGETGVDDENQRYKLATVNLDYRGERLRLVTDFGYQKQRINQGRPVVYVGSGVTGIPHAPDADHNYAQSWSYSQLEDTFGLFRAEYDLNDSWTAYLSGGAKHTRENGAYSALTLTDDSGAAGGGMMDATHDEDNKSAMAGLNGHFATGPVSHQMNLSVAGIWAEQRSAYTMVSKRYPTDLYHPVQTPKPAPTLTGGDYSDPGIVGKTLNKSVAAADTLGFFDDRVLLTVGVRRQNIGTDGWNYAGKRTASYDESITTPVYGLVVKPTEYLSLYANRIEGLAAGPTAPSSAANFGEVFAPNRSKQVEVGAKLDFGRYGGNLAFYRIEQPFSTTDPDSKLFSVDGEQENRGIELNLFGEPLDGLRLLAGGTWIDTELKNTAGGKTDGNRAVGVPTFQYNLGADWDVPGLQGAALNGRVLRTGGQYLDAANDLSIPAWTRFDLGARYAFTVDERAVTLRANLENLANKAYWASTIGGYLTQGDPRTLKLSMTVDF